jgi:hypothetical protein
MGINYSEKGSNNMTDKSQGKKTVIDKKEKKELKRWKALVEYQKTKDILLLQRRLGHKHLRSTIVYLNRSSKLLKLLGAPF